MKLSGVALFWAYAFHNLVVRLERVKSLMSFNFFLLFLINVLFEIIFVKTLIFLSIHFFQTITKTIGKLIAKLKLCKLTN